MLAFNTSLPLSSRFLARTSSTTKLCHRPHGKGVTCSMRPYLERLVASENLSRQEAAAAVKYATSGDAKEAEIAAFLAMLHQKGETSEEVIGVVDALKKEMIPVNIDSAVLDIVGTGGDGFSTVNISTAACILAAAAGCKIAKHGNRSVSSKSGSADVLEALGIYLQLDPAGVKRCIDNAGIAFMFAPAHHPAMKYVKPVRAALKIRTTFNIIGPLINPCSAKFAVIGVYTPKFMDIMADVLVSNHVTKAVVVHTAGMDEYSNTGVSEVIEINNGIKTRTTFDPVSELGMPRVDVADLKGGDAEENAQIIRDVMAGKLKGPIADAIALNAGVGCYVYGLDPTIKDAVKRVQDILASGAAIKTLDKWASESQAAKAAQVAAI